MNPSDGGWITAMGTMLKLVVQYSPRNRQNCAPIEPEPTEEKRGERLGEKEWRRFTVRSRVTRSSSLASSVRPLLQVGQGRQRQLARYNDVMSGDERKGEESRQRERLVVQQQCERKQLYH